MLTGNITRKNKKSLIIKPKKKGKLLLRNKADKLWSIKILSKKYCEVCGRPGTDPHHIIGRKNLRLRHDLRNGCCLCYTHHLGGNQSAHNDPQWFLNEWMVTNRLDDYNYLWEKKNDLEVQVDYEKRIKELS